MPGKWTALVPFEDTDIYQQLSFMRIITPCRSSKCVHAQCFDATSWFSVMEQTTTWLCPVCERALETKDLIIDGLVLSLAVYKGVFVIIVVVPDILTKF